jgi:hypothetical protein
VFLQQVEGGLRFRFSCCGEWGLRNALGKVWLGSGHDGCQRPGHTAPWWLFDATFARWKVARLQAQAGDDEPVVLRLANPQAGRNDWLILELVMGREKPGILYAPPTNVAGTNGGSPFYSLTLRQGERTVTIPIRRFDGWRSVVATEGWSPTLAFEYQFIPSAYGIVKVAIRPKRHPWRAEAVGSYWGLDYPDPIQAGDWSPRRYTTPPVVLESE